MPYAFVHDAPANEQMYREIQALLPESTPPGLISHVAIVRDGGLRYVDVWTTETDWIRFRDDHLGPALGKVRADHGMSNDEWRATHQEVEVIDVWQGGH